MPFSSLTKATNCLRARNNNRWFEYSSLRFRLQSRTIRCAEIRGKNTLTIRLFDCHVGQIIDTAGVPCLRAKTQEH